MNRASQIGLFAGRYTMKVRSIIPPAPGIELAREAGQHPRVHCWTARLLLVFGWLNDLRYAQLPMHPETCNLPFDTFAQAPWATHSEPVECPTIAKDEFSTFDGYDCPAQDLAAVQRVALAQARRNRNPKGRAAGK